MHVRRDSWRKNSLHGEEEEEEEEEGRAQSSGQKNLPIFHETQRNKSYCVRH